MTYGNALPNRPEDLPEELQVGMKVRRGPTWRWHDQDTCYGGSGQGTVVSFREGSVQKNLWVMVEWEVDPAYDPQRFFYRYGEANGEFFADVVPCEPVTQVQKCVCKDIWAPCVCGAFAAEMLAKGYIYNKWAPKGLRWEKGK